MKKLSLITLLALITIGFSSCSSEDDLLIQETSSEDFLKSFSVNKDSGGQFSLNYQLGDGVAADQEKDYKTNTNNIYLYSSQVQTRSIYNDRLAIQDGQLRVNFRNTSNNKIYTITLQDDDIQTSKDSNDNEYIDSYGISGNEDGSYDIPEGNLFPVGTPKTRPEIYTMGHRNPYRISVDPKKHWVFWGDVGPDAREDAFGTRGSRGYDEMNVAIKAGNFGWPLFIANNKAYHAYDYSNGESGAAFDPLKPVNNSKNNTGLQELPPAQPAYIYYDYGESTLHQQLESGGRNAMAGPTFYSDLYKGDNTLPAYYDNKTIIYDWMRGWMKAATFNESGELLDLEPFAPYIDVYNLIDMEIADDGTIYLLEYGSGWFAQNEDSGLGFIKYNGDNLPPTIEDIAIDHVTGTSPLSVNITVNATDLEGDPLSYRYDMGDGEVVESQENKLSYTYNEPGEFQISIEVADDKNMKAAGTR